MIPDYLFAGRYNLYGDSIFNLNTVRDLCVIELCIAMHCYAFCHGRSVYKVNINQYVKFLETALNQYVVGIDPYMAINKKYLNQCVEYDELLTKQNVFSNQRFLAAKFG